MLHYRRFIRTLNMVEGGNGQFSFSLFLSFPFFSQFRRIFFPNFCLPPSSSSINDGRRRFYFLFSFLFFIFYFYIFNPRLLRFLSLLVKIFVLNFSYKYCIRMKSDDTGVRSFCGRRSAVSR